MAVQTMGLNYGWLINLADMISRARQQPAGIRGATGLSTPGFIEKFKAEEKEKAGLEREERMTQEQFAHEIELKGMELESKKATSLAEAMSKERIATMGAEAGVEVAEVGAAGQVAAAQKTTMEKGYEFVDMLFKMDKPSRDELVKTLEAKRAERQAAGVGPLSTITSGGRTITLPGATGAPDMEDPLSLLESIGAYNPETGVVDPKPTGKPVNEIDEYLALVDDMLDKNPQSIIAITTGKGWDELKANMRTIGAEGGFSNDVIDASIAMYEALIPEYEEPPEGGGGLAGAIKGALTPLGLGREELPTEAVPGAEMYLGGAGAYKEGAPKVEKAPGLAKTLEEFIETIITGPFHPAYKKWKSKRTGKVVKTEEKEETTEQDIITDMGTWSKEKIREFQTVAKKAGIYKGPVNGLISHELEDALKKYFKEHPEDWGEAK